MTAAASISPTGSDDPRNISWNCGILDATAIATRNPANIAAPPSDGIGRVCILRGSGIATAPTRNASKRTNGVNSAVVHAATARTTAYPPIYVFSLTPSLQRSGVRPARRVSVVRWRAPCAPPSLRSPHPAPATSRPSVLRVGRELGAEAVRRLVDVGRDVGVVDRTQDPGDQRRDLGHLG